MITLFQYCHQNHYMIEYNPVMIFKFGFTYYHRHNYCDNVAESNFYFFKKICFLFEKVDILFNCDINFKRNHS